MTANTTGSRGCIRGHRGRAGAPRLVCFPHAGGGASSYQEWVTRLLPDAEVLVVQYPGREDRFGEPHAPDMAALADEIAADLPMSADRPLVLFGHSMGSTVAFEVARRIERLCPGGLARLCVSGRPAPHAARATAVHLLSDDDLLADLRALAGTSETLLDNLEFRSLFLPAIRNDYRLIETYRPEPGAGIAAPISGFCGADDPHVRPEEMHRWGEATTSGFGLQVFSGGHFYLHDHAAEIVHEVACRLGATDDPVSG
ncbi:thioesterase II family protein [Streptomyces sulphureus]|uniref:thioesterase II family protein n=1 Tax=Streptomyces sulphureus TaxID=47758 RepID=UPI0004775ED1|nr:alpha/beta fold hydrolase [Streptomyces sulphureus]